MDDVTLMQLDWILYLLRKRIYSIQKPEMVLFDIDSTLFDTFGSQEGEGFNQHYSIMATIHFFAMMVLQETC